MGKRGCAKTLLVLVVALTVTLLAQGCLPSKVDYRGEYPELYSVAINAVLGSTGYLPGEIKHDSEITVLEEDAYGRVLFLYTEENLVSTYSLIISQKSDDEYVWFYPDYCFISAPIDVFAEEDVEKLKELNNWGLGVDLKKCVKVEIVRKKQTGSIKELNVEIVLNRIIGRDEVKRWWITFFDVDEYGRSIYLGEGHLRNAAGTDWCYVVLLFNPDGLLNMDTGYFVLSDPFNYQDELKAFKEQNGWGTPLS